MIPSAKGSAWVRFESQSSRAATTSNRRLSAQASLKHLLSLKRILNDVDDVPEIDYFGRSLCCEGRVNGIPTGCVNSGSRAA